MACKFYKQKKQYSTDSGVTWYDVTPAVYQKGELYEYDSDDCIQPHDYSKQYLTFIPTSGSSTFTFDAPSNSAASANTVYYSLDSGSTWNSMTSGQTVTVNQGNKIYWKATGLDCSTGIGHFYSLGDAGLFDIEGNIMSLVVGDDFESATTISPNQFNSIFSQSQAVNAENLVLPSTTLAKYCYQYMFNGCTSLTTAPVLSATTLAESCYNDMFKDCTSLTTAPELPATTLAVGCYFEMFFRCTSLTVAPVLPATTLADRCYDGMFHRCTSLTSAPELPATTLADDCYSYMFDGCTSLTTAPVLSATTLADGCYAYMFRNCTSLTTAPELPATTLVIGCYQGMFYNCTSLTTASVLSATTLANSCYSYMFYGCTNLNYIKCLATDISAYNCTTSWVYHVASSGTFTKASSMTSWTTGNNGIPNGWTVQNA